VEIKSFHLVGNPFARVITKFSTTIEYRHNTTFGTQNLIFTHGGAVLAVAAGTGDFFSKQHIFAPFDHLIGVLYYILPVIATIFFVL
jgi:hypothetical protein